MRSFFCMKKSPTLVRMRNEAPQRGGLDRVYYMRISGARQAQIFVMSAALRRGSFRAFVCGRALDKVLAEQSGNALLLLDDSGIGTLGGKLLHLIRRDGEDGTNGALIAHAASLLSGWKEYMPERPGSQVLLCALGKIVALHRQAHYINQAEKAEKKACPEIAGVALLDGQLMG